MRPKQSPQFSPNFHIFVKIEVAVLASNVAINFPKALGGLFCFSGFCLKENVSIIGNMGSISDGNYYDVEVDGVMKMFNWNMPHFFTECFRQ